MDWLLPEKKNDLISFQNSRRICSVANRRSFFSWLRKLNELLSKLVLSAVDRETQFNGTQRKIVKNEASTTCDAY